MQQHPANPVHSFDCHALQLRKVRPARTRAANNVGHSGSRDSRLWRSRGGQHLQPRAGALHSGRGRFTAVSGAARLMGISFNPDELPDSLRVGDRIP